MATRVDVPVTHDGSREGTPDSLMAVLLDSESARRLWRETEDAVVPVAEPSSLRPAASIVSNFYFSGSTKISIEQMIP